MAEQAGSEEAARQILRYVLLHRARGHQFDLQRELKKLSGPSGTSRISVEDLNSRPRLHYDVLMQVAVEYQLGREPVRRLFEADPTLLRFLYDTLYYLSRLWENGSPQFAIVEEDFKAYLEKCARAGDGARANGDRDNGSANGHDLVALPPETVRELHAIAQSMALSLTRPSQLCADVEAQTANFRGESTSEHVLGVIRSLPPLLDKDGTGYIWSCDFWGRTIDPRRRKLDAFFQRELQARRALIDGFERRIAELALVAIDPPSLADAFHILPKTPQWSAVHQALKRAAEAQRGEDPPETVSESIAIIRAYSGLLEENLASLVWALFGGWVLGFPRLRDPTGPEGHKQAPSEGLAVLAAQLSLDKKAPQATRAALKRSAESLAAALEMPEDIKGLLSEGPNDLANWSARVKAIAEKLDDPRWQTGWRDLPLAENAWERWRRRFDVRIPTRGEYQPDGWELLSAAARTGPAAYFTGGADQATLLEWSSALLGTAVEAGSGPPVPLWMAVPALVNLGFASAVPAVLDALQQLRVNSPGTDEGLKEELGIARTWAERERFKTVQPRERRGLVLYQTETLASTWSSLEPSDAAIVLSLDAVKAMPRPLIEALNFDRVAYELSDPKQLEGFLQGTAKPTEPRLPEPVADLAKHRSAIILATQPSTRIPIRRSDFAVSPDRIEEIFSRADLTEPSTAAGTRP